MAERKEKDSFLGFIAQSTRAAKAKEEIKKQYRRACAKVTAQELDYNHCAVLSDN